MFITIAEVQPKIDEINLSNNLKYEESNYIRNI